MNIAVLLQKRIQNLVKHLGWVELKHFRLAGFQIRLCVRRVFTSH